jgi:hypothetical protein
LNTCSFALRPQSEFFSCTSSKSMVPLRPQRKIDIAVGFSDLKIKRERERERERGREGGRERERE